MQKLNNELFEGKNSLDKMFAFIIQLETGTIHCILEVHKYVMDDHLGQLIHLFVGKTLKLLK